MADYWLSFGFNFVFILASIVLFFAPFVLVFIWRHRQQIKQARPHFNYFMEQFFQSREADFLVLAWAASEAFIWFIIPEFLLILVVFIRAKQKFNLVKYDIYGTILGTIIGISWHLPDNALLKLPYIYQGMIDHVRDWYDQYQVWGLLFQPFSGVPYKLFNHIMADYQFFLPLFLFLAVIARISRYIIIYQVTKHLYPLVYPIVKRHYGILFLLAILLFTALLMRVSGIYK